MLVDVAIICIGVLAELEAQTGTRFHRNCVLDLDDNIEHRRFAARITGLPQWATVRLVAVPPWFARRCLVIGGLVSRWLGAGVTGRAAAAFSASAVGAWQYARTGDHSLHLLCALSLALIITTDDRECATLTRAIVGWHVGSAGWGKLRQGGLAWASAASRDRCAAAVLTMPPSGDTTDLTADGATRPFARLLVSAFRRLPPPLASAMGAGALVAELVVPLVCTACDYCCYDGDDGGLFGDAAAAAMRHRARCLRLAAALLVFHIGVWAATGVCFIANFFCYAATAYTALSSSSSSEVGGGGLSVPVQCVVACLWLATWGAVETFPLSHLGVFAYSARQADAVRCAFFSATRSSSSSSSSSSISSLVTRRSLVAFSADSTIQCGDTVARNLYARGNRLPPGRGRKHASETCDPAAATRSGEHGSTTSTTAAPGSAVTSLDLASATLRVIADGYPTLADPCFLAAVPSPHGEGHAPAECAAAAARWLAAAPRFVDIHVRPQHGGALPLSRAAVVDTDVETNRIVRIVAFDNERECKVG